MARNADGEASRRPVLVVFGGLPGTGKTTIASAVATARRATYLRIDAIEQAIRSAGVLAGDVGPAGYQVARALAESNLKTGQCVVADCVNPVAASREGWKAAASRGGAQLLEVEVSCSDPDEHRRRLEHRASDIPGLKMPSWDDVQRRPYEPWCGPRLVIDTARLGVDAAVSTVSASIDELLRITDLPPSQVPCR